MSKYLNEAGLAYYDSKQKQRLAQKADVSALPTKLSQLTNDAGFITGSDVPELPEWASGASKPAYTAEEVGAIPAADAETFAKKSEVPVVPAWAKEAAKPTYTAAEVGAIPAADADNFALKSDLTNVYKYKGSVATAAELPASGNTAGDVYNVTATDMNYGWTGTAWDPLGQMFSIDSITNAEIDTILSA